MVTGMISIEGMRNRITEASVMINVECQPLPRGVGHMRLDSRMTDTLIVVGEGFQSTPGSRALTRDPFSFKVWLTGTGHTKRAMIEIIRLEAGCMFQVPSVSAEPSEQQ